MRGRGARASPARIGEDLCSTAGLSGFPPATSQPPLASLRRVPASMRPEPVLMWSGSERHSLQTREQEVHQPRSTPGAGHRCGAGRGLFALSSNLSPPSFLACPTATASPSAQTQRECPDPPGSQRRGQAAKTRGPLANEDSSLLPSPSPLEGPGGDRGSARKSGRVRIKQGHATPDNLNARSGTRTEKEDLQTNRALALSPLSSSLFPLPLHHPPGEVNSIE